MALFLSELVFLVMNPGYNADNWKIIQNNARILGIPLTVFETEIFDVVAGIDKNPCYLCARMRRGYLYSKRASSAATRSPSATTSAMWSRRPSWGMFYGSQLQAMPPKLHSTNFPGMTLIRPMYCIREDDIIAWRRYNELEFIQCACRFTEPARSATTAEAAPSGRRSRSCCAA